MFFCTNIIYKPPDQATCPACGQACWESLQWQLPLRYSPSCLIMVLVDGMSLSFLALVAAGYRLGRETLETFLLTAPGAFCALAFTTLSFLLAWWLVKMRIIVKYWSDFKKIALQRCSHCSSTYLFVFDSNNASVQREEEYRGI